MRGTWLQLPRPWTRAASRGCGRGVSIKCGCAGVCSVGVLGMRINIIIVHRSTITSLSLSPVFFSFSLGNFQLPNYKYFSSPPARQPGAKASCLRHTQSILCNRVGQQHYGRGASGRGERAQSSAGGDGRPGRGRVRGGVPGAEKAAKEARRASRQRSTGVPPPRRIEVAVGRRKGLRASGRRTNTRRDSGDHYRVTHATRRHRAALPRTRRTDRATRLGDCLLQRRPT